VSKFYYLIKFYVEFLPVYNNVHPGDRTTCCIAFNKWRRAADVVHKDIT